MCVLGSVTHHAAQVIVETFDPGLVLELIESYRIDGLVAVPTMLIAMKEHPDFHKRDLSSLKHVACGGATVPASLAVAYEERLGTAFSIVFGQTECSPIASMTVPTDNQIDRSSTLGPPLPHIEVKIIDPQNGGTAPFGQIGEYCTRGYHVMREYNDNPDATAKAIDQDGWLHTGDLASMDSRGYCSIEGRLKDLIIRGGENIYPRELEEVLFSHPSVIDAAVVGLPDPLYGEVVGAFIRAAPGQTPDRETLFAYLRESLSPQKTPTHWFLVDDFPMTGSGKVKKFALRQLWEDGKMDDKSF